MTIRFPSRCKAKTSTVGTGAYAINETAPLAGYRTLTRATSDLDLLDGDQIGYLAIDTTVINGPDLLELGLGTWNHSAKTVSRDIIYQPGGSPISWGGGTRDFFVIDNPVLFLLLTGGTLSGLLKILISGSVITPEAATAFLVQRSSAASTEVGMSLIAGVSGKSKINLGDTADEDAGGLVYDHATNALVFRTNGAEALKLDSAGALRNVAGTSKYVLFPTGGTTKLSFNCAPPTGWTRINVLGERLGKYATASDTPEAQGGSWTVSGLITPAASTESHVLTISQIPPHDHNFLAASGGGLPGGVSAPSSSATVTLTSQTGGGAGHYHDIPQSTVTSSGAWRPAYEIIVKASFD